MNVLPMQDPKADILAAEFLIDYDLEAAAARANLEPSEARKIFARPSTKKRMREMARDIAAKVGISAEYVLATTKDIVERCRQAVPVTDTEGNPTGEYRFDAANALKGCELLGKHLRLFTEQVNHKVDINLHALVMQSIELEKTITTKITLTDLLS